MRILIIEDELPAAERAKQILSEIDPNMNVLQVCNTIESSVKWLKTNPAPDLILMDIELRDGRSFEIFGRVPISSPVVFITAYDEFAIKAIKFSALDYLLKPIDRDELTLAIQKIKNISEKKNTIPSDYSVLHQFASIISAGRIPKRIAVNNMNTTLFVDIDEIIHLEADSNYTKIFLTNDKKIISSKTLKEYEELLSGLSFLRVHSAHLINLAFVEKYIKGDGGTLVMKDGSNIEVSRQRKKNLLITLSLTQ